MIIFYFFVLFIVNLNNKSFFSLL